MDNNSFPSFNFAYTSSTDLRQSYTGYGNTGALLVYQDKDENTLRCVTQKKGNTTNKRVRLIANKPTLPLKPPNRVCQRFSCEKNNDRDQKWNCSHNLANLTTDHVDIVHESLAKFVREEVQELGWTPHIVGTFSTGLLLLPSIFTHFDDLSDIPLELLDDLLQESFVVEKFEWTGEYFGNCVAHQMNSSGGGDPTVVLAHPCGEFMDKISFSSVQFRPDDGVLSTKLLPGKNTFNFPNKIRQINAVDAGESFSSVMAVRTDYTCSFIKQEYGHDNELAMSVVGNLVCKTKPCSVAVSPYIPGEAIVAMETGSVCLWSAGKQASLQVVKKCSACVAQDFDWYLCEFGTHPRHVIRCNKTNVELLDLRDNSSNSKDLMTLPSPHLFDDDQFSAIQRHPDNPYHYFVGTIHSLMILDERFLQHPVLKWHNSSGESIKHIDVVTNALPGCGDVLLVCGGYNSCDIHCYQYCYGENSPYSLGTAADIGGLPAQSTSSPWKISSYNEWPDLVDYPIKAEVARKLNQPLLGLTCISNPSSSGNTGTLAVIQMSKTGDLFYQCFTPHENTLTEEVDQGHVYYYEEMDMDIAGSGGCGSTKPVLTEEDQYAVENWLEYATHDRAETNNLALQEISDTCHFYDAELVREKVFSKLEDDSKCILCEDVRYSSEDMVGEDDFPEKCNCCGLDRIVSENLSSARSTERTVVTNSYLGNSYEIRKLEWFDEKGEYAHPLAVSLLKNWYSKEQTPINLGIPVESQDVVKKQESVPKMQDSNKKVSPEKEVPHHPRINESYTKVEKKKLSTSSQNHSSPSLCKESSENNRLHCGTSIERKEDSKQAIQTNGFPPDLGSQLTSSPMISPLAKGRKSGVKKKHARVVGF